RRSGAQARGVLRRGARVRIGRGGAAHDGRPPRERRRRARATAATQLPHGGRLRAGERGRTVPVRDELELLTSSRTILSAAAQESLAASTRPRPSRTSAGSAGTALPWASSVAPPAPTPGPPPDATPNARPPARRRRARSRWGWR